MHCTRAAMRTAKALHPEKSNDDPALLATAEIIERELGLSEVIASFDSLLMRFDPGEDGPTRKKARRALRRLTD